MKKRRPLIVYIDAIGVATAETIAESAARRGIATALVCQPGALRAHRSQLQNNHPSASRPVARPVAHPAAHPVEHSTEHEEHR